MIGFDDKVSGFGFFSASIGHTYVGIYKNAEGKYYVKINYCRSHKTFDCLNDVKGLWRCIKEIELDLLEIYNDRHKSEFERGGSVCPETPLG